MEKLKKIALGVVMCFGMSQAAGLSVGDVAPGFSLPDDANIVRSLDGFRGKFVVLYFYPKDNTPGCTKQACQLRDRYGDFQKEDIVVLGINYDSPETHRAFKEKYHLPFFLLSDRDKSVAKKYGAKNWWFIPIPYRMTFVVDPEGIVQEIMNSVDISTHAAEILKIIREKKASRG
jgi:peroxiredoxin Q/BCP